jgi:hypothetical protein
MNLEQIVSLLGKSERDEQVKAMLDAFKVKQPLKRPKRGEEDSNVGLPKVSRMEFCFTLAESMKKYTSDYLEGELVFNQVFFWPNDEDIAGNMKLPFGVGIQKTRAEHFKQFGSPEYGNPDLMLYRWELNGIKLFLVYHDGKETLKEVDYTYDVGE